jgi:hypothetical protein
MDTSEEAVDSVDVGELHQQWEWTGGWFGRLGGSRGWVGVFFYHSRRAGEGSRGRATIYSLLLPLSFFDIKSEIHDLIKGSFLA